MQFSGTRIGGVFPPHQTMVFYNKVLCTLYQLLPLLEYSFLPRPICVVNFCLFLKFCIAFPVCAVISSFMPTWYLTQSLFTVFMLQCSFFNWRAMGSQFDSQIPGLELEKQWFKKLECFSVEVLLLSLSFECPEEFCLNNWLKKNNKSACCYHLGI